MATIESEWGSLYEYVIPAAELFGQISLSPGNVATFVLSARRHRKYERLRIANTPFRDMALAPHLAHRNVH